MFALICGTTWRRRASDSANAVAVKERDAIAAKMTTAQIAEARGLASEWKPTK
jgi:hypothetical protein